MLKYLEEIIIKQPAKLLVVYVGRWQPFHNGHYGVYKSLVNQYGEDSVYLMTADPKIIDDRNPFSFKQKKEMINACGIQRIKKIIGSAYNADDIAKSIGIDETKTVLIVALGQKDSERLSRHFYKGEYSEFKTHKAMNQAGYIHTIALEDDSELRSSTKIREHIANGNISAIKGLVPDGVFRWLSVHKVINPIHESKGHHLHIEQLTFKGVNELREAIETFTDLRDQFANIGISNKKTLVATKMDGAPSTICGIDEHGKFFISSKAALAKNPRVFYSIDEIQNDTISSQGLKTILIKIMPYLKQLKFDGIYQGDLLFTEDIKKRMKYNDQEYISFTPNTITYAVEADSDLGKIIDRAKIGIDFHTKYGGTVEHLEYEGQLTENPFQSTDDVWTTISEIVNYSGNINFTDDEIQEINSNLSNAGKLFRTIPREIFNRLQELKFDDMFEYAINDMVKLGNVDFNNIDITKMLGNRIKTIGKARYNEAMKFYNDNQEYFKNLMSIYQSLWKVKTIFINKFNAISRTLKEFVVDDDGIKITNPEGFCGINLQSGNIIKLVDRLEFSQRNFNFVKRW